jgi:hypothetical protein
MKSTGTAISAGSENHPVTGAEMGVAPPGACVAEGSPFDDDCADISHTQKVLSSATLRIVRMRRSWVRRRNNMNRPPVADYRWEGNTFATSKASPPCSAWRA